MTLGPGCRTERQGQTVTLVGQGLSDHFEGCVTSLQGRGGGNRRSRGGEQELHSRCLFEVRGPRPGARPGAAWVDAAARHTQCAEEGKERKQRGHVSPWCPRSLCPC